MRPQAKYVIPLDDYRLLVTFDNKKQKVFDVKPYLDFKPFQQLKNKTLFETVHVAGLSVVWVSGRDICPDELYFNSVKLEV